MQQNEILQVKNLHRTIEMKDTQIRVLRGLDFSVREGEWIALMGPSGSGKSTLLGILGGVDSPTTGTVILDGKIISELSETNLAKIRNQSIGIVFQNFNLIPTMSAQENVEVPLYISDQARDSAKLAARAISAVGLSDRAEHLPHQLSGGQQQRVAIARALVTQPKLLLADEPTGNLDSTSGKLILDLIHQMRDQLKITVIMVTHDPDVAAYADRVLHMIDGQIIDEAIKRSEVHHG